VRAGRVVGVILAFAALAVLLVFGLRGYLPRARSWGRAKQIDLRQYDIRELPELGFLKPGAALLLGRYRLVMPPVHSLFLRDRGHLREVTYPDDLSGYVTIHNDDEALLYARLFSSLVIPTTLPETDWDEVLRVGALNQRLFFGSDAFWDRTPAEVRHWDKPGTPHLRPHGIILDEEWRANGLSEPSVARTNAGWVVTRWLWTLDAKRGARTYPGRREADMVYRVEHTISPDGAIMERIVDRKKLSGVILVESMRI